MLACILCIDATIHGADMNVADMLDKCPSQTWNAQLEPSTRNAPYRSPGQRVFLHIRVVITACKQHRSRSFTSQQLIVKACRGNIADRLR